MEEGIRITYCGGRIEQVRKDMHVYLVELHLCSFYSALDQQLTS